MINTEQPVQAQAHANYPRDHRGIVGQIKGPSALGEFWRAVDATYDSVTDTTHVGFRIVPHTELMEELDRRRSS